MKCTNYEKNNYDNRKKSVVPRTIVGIVLAVATVCLFLFTSCSGPSSDTNTTTNSNENSTNSNENSTNSNENTTNNDDTTTTATDITTVNVNVNVLDEESRVIDTKMIELEIPQCSLFDEYNFDKLFIADGYNAYYEVDDKVGICLYYILEDHGILTLNLVYNGNDLSADNFLIARVRADGVVDGKELFCDTFFDKAGKVRFTRHDFGEGEVGFTNTGYKMKIEYYEGGGSFIYQDSNGNPATSEDFYSTKYGILEQYEVYMIEGS